jgi:hypothetical protein
MLHSVAKRCLIVAMSIVLPSIANAAEKVNIAITAPTDKSTSAGRETVVKGTVTPLKAGQFLWILARAQEFDPLWWPQREAKVLASGGWSGVAVLGEPRDVGKNFDIAAVVVDLAGHEEIKKHWINAVQTGEWRPMQIPRSIVMKVVSVKKAGH